MTTTGDQQQQQPSQIAGPTVIHKVKSKLGYTEMHTAAPGFGEDVRIPFFFPDFFLIFWLLP